MHKLNMQSTNHLLYKQNLVTVSSKDGYYDLYKCKLCGLRGKRYGLEGRLSVDGRLSKDKVFSCPDASAPRTIRIIWCQAAGKHFTNITPGSVHKVIDPPKGQNNSSGVWVMGTSEPVKIFFDEFVNVTEE